MAWYAVTSKSSAVLHVAIYTLKVWTELKGKWEESKVIMKVLSGSVPYCKQDQSNFEVGKRNSPKSTGPVIYKHNRDRELLVGASAEGRSKATSDLSVHTHKWAQAHTHSLLVLLRNLFTNGQTRTHSLSDINVCLHIHTHSQTTEESSGVCCQDIIKTESQPPLGMTEFDQSKALFQVRTTFQLLKLMNSLYWLMKSLAANEVDSVFVFT